MKNIKTSSSKISLSGLLFLLIIIVSAACEPDLTDAFEVYQINKGDHYCNGRHPESLQTTTLRFEARFDETAIYTFNEAGFQDSKNKLLGFSDCNSLHHENSARIAWQWYNDQIEIFAYCYRNGERVEAYLGAVMPGETAHYEIQLTDNYYVFHFRDKEVKIERGSTCDVGLYQMLWPYFGGQIPAPHDIQIFIKRF